MKFYITTPIYYINSRPHIGHSYCSIIADVLSRYKKLQNYDVLFTTGTDEHGQKAEKAAAENNLPPQVYVDQMMNVWKNTWDYLNIEYDDFIRTTSDRHKKCAQYIFTKLYQKGDIYKGQYEGLYCMHCETFFDEDELIEGRCPNPWCYREVEKIKEEAYFFKLKKYENDVINFLEKNKDFIYPMTRYNEVLSFAKMGLKDICISRKRLKWGIPVPFDTQHVIYVWFEALINYLSVCGYLTDEAKFNKYWPCDIHLIGKDIIRFHCIIWVAMLMALDIELPKMIVAHGFWNIKGEKISKSKGEVIEPQYLTHELIHQLNIEKDIAIDVIRYFLLREIPFGGDGEFELETLYNRYNADLANDLGNLIYRTLPMIEKYSNGIIPPLTVINDVDKELQDKSNEYAKKIEELMDNLKFYEALITIWQLINSANKYIEVTQPWKLYKENNNRLNTVLYNLVEILRKISIFIYPFMPTVSKLISQQISIEKIDEFAKTKQFGILQSGVKINKLKPIFPRKVK